MADRRSVLIVTHRFDPTADKVVTRLNDRDVPVFRMDTSEFPERLSVAAELTGDRWSGRMRTARRGLTLDDIVGIYYRRPTSYELHPELSENERHWSEVQARLGFGGLLAALDPWLNHPYRVGYAEYKPVQLQAAAASGLRVPRTLLTNEPSRARSFVSALDRAVYKPFGGTGVEDEDGVRQVFRTVVDGDQCGSPAVGRTMHLFQEWVPKDYDVRLIVVDDRFFAARIDGRSNAAKIDWRTDYDNLTYQVVETPPAVRSGVARLMDTLGLRFGALDFVVTPDGEWWFLECDPNGQWAWVEDETELPIADAITVALAGPGPP